MTEQVDYQVLIVGAGPVGMTMAMDLASRDIPVTVIEQKHFSEQAPVKCNHVSSRTMEQFRRLGVASKLRDAGLPEDHPNDVVFRTSMTGTELARIPIPCRRDRFTSTEGPDTWWPTPEPPHRINQIYLEPILLEHARGYASLDLHERTQLLDFRQEAGVVHARLRNVDTGDIRTVRARYLIGCDGGSSTVREQMGARFEGDAILQKVQSTFIRAPQLMDLLPGKKAWGYHNINPRRCGTVFAIDGKEKWLIHNHLNPKEDYDMVDRDTSIRNILGVDDTFTYEVISQVDWVGRRLVASRFRNGNVFIAGDAAHIWAPYAGYGMNTGIADALNLSWLLAARLQGWAEESILDAYEAERHPITEQVSHFVMRQAEAMIKARLAVPDNIEDDDEAGRKSREIIGKESYDINVDQYCCAGLNYGYYYQNSPILAHDEEKAPSYSLGNFTESTVPGCRTPHIWLPDGQSLYDQFGPGYTLIRFNPDVDVSGFKSLAEQKGVPLVVLDLDEQPDVYQHDLLLARTDQHVVWRGDVLPADLGQFVDMLRGIPASTEL